MDESDKSNIIEFNFDTGKPPEQIFTEIKKIPHVDECQHNHVKIDEATDSVICSDCGERLSPMWVLKRLAQRHNQFYWNYERLFKMTEKAAKMNRCKCQFCGKMTKIVKG